MKLKLKTKWAELDKKGRVAIKVEDDAIFALIDSWSGIEQLFNCKHGKKVKGILYEKGIEVMVKQTAHKIHSLRNYYSAERHVKSSLPVKIMFWAK